MRACSNSRRSSTDDGRGFAFAEGGEAKGHARKTTGSYYTPDSLVQALLDSRARSGARPRRGGGGRSGRGAALCHRARPGLRLRAFPACSGAADRDAAGARSHRRRRFARRLTATRCATWRAPASTASIAIRWRSSLPRWRCGSRRSSPASRSAFSTPTSAAATRLLGVFDLKALAQGIPDAAYKPLTGDDKETAKHFAKRNKAEREGQGALDFAGGGGPVAGSGADCRRGEGPARDAGGQPRGDRRKAQALRGRARRSAPLEPAHRRGPLCRGVPDARRPAACRRTATR